MKIFSVKRKSKYVNIYNENMGRLKCKEITIYATFLSIPYKKIHQYRETYHGNLKNINECDLNKV